MTAKYRCALDLTARRSGSIGVGNTSLRVVGPTIRNTRREVRWANFAEPWRDCGSSNGAAAQSIRNFGRNYERRYEGGIYYWRESRVGVGDGADSGQARDYGDFGLTRFKEGAGSGGEIARRRREIGGGGAF